MIATKLKLKCHAAEAGGIVDLLISRSDTNGTSYLSLQPKTDPPCFVAKPITLVLCSLRHDTFVSSIARFLGGNYSAEDVYAGIRIIR